MVLRTLMLCSNVIIKNFIKNITITTPNPKPNPNVSFTCLTLMTMYWKNELNGTAYRIGNAGVVIACLQRGFSMNKIIFIHQDSRRLSFMYYFLQRYTNILKSTSFKK